MNYRKRWLGGGAALALSVLVVPLASAQQWSAEQREVWAFIEDCNAQFVAKNEAGVLDCFHDDFSGWRYGDTVPRTKQTIAEFLPIDLEGESLALDLRPISIRVFGNFAIAHYFLSEASRNASGEVERQQMIWTDVLLKQGNRWYWVADHGGNID